MCFAWGLKAMAVVGCESWVVGFNSWVVDRGS